MYGLALCCKCHFVGDDKHRCGNVSGLFVEPVRVIVLKLRAARERVEGVKPYVTFRPNIT